MKFIIPRTFQLGFSPAMLLLSLSLSLCSLGTVITPCGNPRITDDPPTCNGAAGNDSRSEYGPQMKIPTGMTGMPPATNQTFFQPAGSNGISKALDLEIAGTTSNLPLKFERQYQSRVREGMSDDMGHGVTWTHSFSYRMWSTASNKRSIIFPDGTICEFTSGGNVTFEGETQIEHLPASGRGERLYQGGTGQNWFTLILSSGARHVFERITAAGTTLYHPRYAADAEGRRHTYTTDSKARIIRVEDGGGNSISLQYGPIQINRKQNILLKEISSTPTSGWNEIIQSNATAYRWYQVFSSDNSFCNFAEVEFYGRVGGGNETKLSGTPYGTGPAHINFPTSTFEKAFDGDTATSFYFARRLNGITGLDLGAGNEAKLTKIRFNPNTGAGAVPLLNFL